jgi:hypothetical protein
MSRLMPVLVLLAGLPLSGTAQSGTVRYDQSTRLDFKLPPGMPMPDRLPKATTRPMQLTFTPEATLFAAAPRPADGEAGVREAKMAVEAGAAGGRAVFISRDGGGMAAGRITMEGGGDMMIISGGPMGAGGRMDAVTGAWTNLSDGSFIEVRELLGRTFRIPEERPKYSWKLTGEQATFLGHPVFQATARQDSTSLEAWFTPDIPISAGPAQYGGLPGLILTLAVDSNRIVYTATAIDTTTAIGQLKAPSDGSKVTREEYEKIVKEKMDEIAKQRRGRGN